MAITVTATNIKTTSAPEPQWHEHGGIVQIVTAAVANTLAQNDTIVGPSIPAGCYLTDVIVDATDLDSDGTPTVAFTVGIAGSLAKFISASAVATTGGIARMNVAAAAGYVPAADTPVLLTITATATAPEAGTIKMAVLYTQAP